MAFLGPILAIGGTLFQGVAAFGQANYQSQVAKNNAQIAAYNSNVAAQQAQTAQLRSDREYAAQRGQFLAQTGASGVDVGSGSTGDVLGLINRNRVEAGTDIRRQGEAQSIGFNNQQAAYLGQASAAKSAGISSLIGSVFKAGGQAAGAFGGGSDANYQGLGPTKQRVYPWSTNG